MSKFEVTQQIAEKRPRLISMAPIGIETRKKNDIKQFSDKRFQKDVF